jgi:threonine dehydratase
MNPTGSFKDRGMTMAVSKAIGHGAKAVICASTGNTSASAAAYAGNQAGVLTGLRTATGTAFSTPRQTQTIRSLSLTPSEDPEEK